MGLQTTEPHVLGLLEKRYRPPEWIFLTHVRNCTGFAKRVRTADAMALNTYPSRGLELHGFEVKVDRGDWLRELRDPEKAADLFRYCERWWVVAPKGVVKKDELPKTWGLLEERGTRLQAVVPAPVTPCDPFARVLAVSICRNMQDECKRRSSLAASTKMLYEAERRGAEAATKAAARRIETLQGRLDSRSKRLDELERALGSDARWARVEDLRRWLEVGRRVSNLGPSIEAAIGRLQEVLKFQREVVEKVEQDEA